MHSFCFGASLKICLAISLVSRACFDVFGSYSVAVSCFFFFESVSLQLFCRELCLFHTDTLISIIMFCLLFVDFQLSVITLVVSIQFAIEFTKDVGISRCDDFALFIFKLSDEYPFLR